MGRVLASVTLMAQHAQSVKGIMHLKIVPSIVRNVFTVQLVMVVYPETALAHVSEIFKVLHAINAKTIFMVLNVVRSARVVGSMIAMMVSTVTALVLCVVKLR